MRKVQARTTKLQDPRSKIQRNLKFQPSKVSILHTFSRLDVGTSLDVGVWILGLFPSLAFGFIGPHVGREGSFGSAVSFCPMGNRRSLSSLKASGSQPACSGDKSISWPSFAGPSL